MPPLLRFRCPEHRIDMPLLINLIKIVGIQLFALDEALMSVESGPLRIPAEDVAGVKMLGRQEPDAIFSAPRILPSQVITIVPGLQRTTGKERLPHLHHHALQYATFLSHLFMP